MLYNKTKRHNNTRALHHNLPESHLDTSPQNDIEPADKRKILKAKHLERTARRLGITSYAHIAFCIDGSIAIKKTPVPNGSKRNKALSLCDECDASSLPHGGARSTAKAGGILREGLASPYVIDNTLYLTSGLFCPNGTTLDCLTPLARSCNALAESCRALLALFGYKPQTIFPAVGVEQEFFLLDAATAQARRDIIHCGRSLLTPTVSQHATGNYLSPLPERVEHFFDDVTQRLSKMNIDVTTVHSEGAPHQYELVTGHENATTACMHNLIAMQTLQAAAQKHALTCLFDEKPFEHTNGSGKHSNWSIFADKLNLIDPQTSPPIIFALLLSAIIQALDIYGEIIFATVDSISNLRRLGKNEAPPNVPSVCIGEELLHWLNSIPTAITPPPSELIDRNRTAPVVFTRCKLELRILGSNGAIAELNTAFNTAVAAVLRDFPTELCGTDITLQAQRLIRRTLDTHGGIVFNGDYYTTPDHRKKMPHNTQLLRAAQCLSSPKAVKLFTQTKVLSHEELLIRARCKVKSRIESAATEAKTLVDILRNSFLPCARKHLNDSLALYAMCAEHKLPCHLLHRHILRLSRLSECCAARIELLQAARLRMFNLANAYVDLTLHDDIIDSNASLSQAYTNLCILTEKAGRLAYRILHSLPNTEKPFATDCELLS